MCSRQITMSKFSIAKQKNSKLHSKAGFEGDLWRRRTPNMPGEACGVGEVGGSMRDSMVAGVRVEADQHVKTRRRDAWTDFP